VYQEGDDRLDIRYKTERVIRWGRRIGLINSIIFEFKQTIRRPIISFYHRELKRKIHIRCSSSDISVFENIFIEDELHIELEDPTFIIDGGANCGLAALYFACRYPRARIVAVEPSAENCELCRRNTTGLNVEVIQSAIWSSSTNLKIENPDAEPWSFQCVEVEECDPEGFEARDVHSLLSGMNCDLLKLDIEGAELEVFQDTTWLKYVSAILVEVHSKIAEQRIRSACEGWKVSQSGEKLFLER